MNSDWPRGFWTITQEPNFSQISDFSIKLALHKIPYFHLISWSENFVERNCAFPQNFNTKKLGEIMVFYAVEKTNNNFILKQKNWPHNILIERTYSVIAMFYV